MECSLPPPITEDQISAAIDGFADSNVQQHIAQCASCAARVRQAQMLEDVLKIRLNRWDCPAPQRLGEYVLGLVSGRTEERNIRLHLEECASCKAEVEDLNGFLVSDSVSLAAAQKHPQPAASPSAPQRRSVFGQILATILPRTPGLAMRGTATRGHAGGPIMAEAEGTTIILDVQPVSEGQVRIMGQLAAEDYDSWIGALVELRQNGTIQATTTVDDNSNFDSGLIPAGAIQLAITPSAGRTLIIPEIDVSGQA
jgi:anti-sigma factor RsiW